VGAIDRQSGSRDLKKFEEEHVLCSEKRDSWSVRSVSGPSLFEKIRNEVRFMSVMELVDEEPRQLSFQKTDSDAELTAAIGNSNS